MIRVAVLGKSGMLGSAVYRILKKSERYDVIGTTRKELDAESANIDDIKNIVKGCDYIINCIGLIKTYIHDDNFIEAERAIKINALFPYKLAACEIKVIQIATDCVYDGVKGNYMENAVHNALDIYGKTKSLGEVARENFLNLRCSIIGLEANNKKSLLEWFINQGVNAQINGYKNHLWNGISTIAFAKICKGIIENDKWFHGLQHIIPNDITTKADMLTVFAKVFDRKDIAISYTNAQERIDRTILTINPSRNKELWAMAGYDKTPNISDLVKELKQNE
jgi:dTDP-4-dehydrorhamnose reductase